MARSSTPRGRVSGPATAVYAAGCDPTARQAAAGPLNLQRRSTLAGEAAAAAAEVETALVAPADPTSAAFFDVDNTVMQGASIFHLARGLHRRDFFTTRDILGAAWKQAYFRVVGVEDPDHVAEARSSALGFIAGHTVGRAGGARRGDLRRGDGAPDLAGHPRPGPAAPRPGPAGLAGHGRARSRSRRSSPAGSGSPAPSARSPSTWTASTPAGWWATCCTGRPRREAVQALAEREGLDLARVLGVLRLLQRPADAVAWSATRARSTPTPGCARTRGRRAGGSATTAPGARPPGPACWSAAVAGAATGDRRRRGRPARPSPLTPPGPPHRAGTRRGRFLPSAMDHLCCRYPSAGGAAVHDRGFGGS